MQKVRVLILNLFICTLTMNLLEVDQDYPVNKMKKQVPIKNKYPHKSNLRFLGQKLNITFDVKLDIKHNMLITITKE